MRFLAQGLLLKRELKAMARFKADREYSSLSFDEKIKIWTAYYRNNIHRFAEEYLGVHLKLFQKILLVMMNLSTTNVIISCRGLGKTFLTALFCVIRCILYPGTMIVACSKTRKQGAEIIKKVKDILMPMSPMLRTEVEDIQVNQYNSVITFKNGSVVQVCTANDNARGLRCNLLIVDEFRMVDKKIYNTVLKNSLTSIGSRDILANRNIAEW